MGLKMGGPLSAEIDALLKDADTGQLAPFYLDLLGEGPRLQARMHGRAPADTSLRGAQHPLALLQSLWACYFAWMLVIETDY